MKRTRATIATVTAALSAVILGLSACGLAQPSATPSGAPSAEASGAPSTPPSDGASAATPGAPAIDALEGVNLACIGVVAADCRQVAERVRAELPAARGRPFSIVIQGYGCATSPCVAPLGDAGGIVTVEFLDPGEPIVRTVFGPVANITFGGSEMAWSGLQQPASERVEGQGPFPYELGHCGLLWKVDFDGSFWLPLGDIDGNSSALVNADSGTMLLVDPNRAVFTDAAGASVDLVRHPGQKHVWLCR